MMAQVKSEVGKNLGNQQLYDDAWNSPELSNNEMLRKFESKYFKARPNDTIADMLIAKDRTLKNLFGTRLELI